MRSINEPFCGQAFSLLPGRNRFRWDFVLVEGDGCSVSIRFHATLRYVERYQVKAAKLAGTSGTDVRKQAEVIMRVERARTKRQPYVRSAYFSKDKVFIQPFWQHAWDKSWRDRMRRLRFLPCALELIRHSHLTPGSRQSSDDPNVILHRFAGETLSGETFFVQVRQNKKTGRKDFMSVFPGP
jgi:hypothetical protein